VNGQRPSAALFLLDGVENNNALATGPLTPLPPEALQEYRISTSAFSAEYGKTSGTVANAVSRSGTSSWHGLVYGYWKPSGLLARGPTLSESEVQNTSEYQPGLFVGGPAYRKSIFTSVAVELFRFESQGPPTEFVLPTAEFVQRLPQGSLAAGWFLKFPPPSVPASSGLTANVTLAPPTTIKRDIVIPRLDYTPGGGTQRLSARVAWAGLHRPDFGYSPYPEFLQPLDLTTLSAAANWVVNRSAGQTQELRFGANHDRIAALRPHPEVPAMDITLSAPSAGGVVLPGSSVSYSFLNTNTSYEGGYSLTRIAGRHTAKVGLGVLARGISGFQEAYKAGSYTFDSFESFAADAPASAVLTVSRASPLLPVLPDFRRNYRTEEWYGFAQDSFRVTSHLTLSYGLRYDYFRPIRNTGPQPDLLLQLDGPGGLSAQIERAQFAASKQLFATDTNDFAGRLGVSWSPDSASRTVLRASYGQFYDRVFDNIWLTVGNNSYQHVVTALDPTPRNYSDPAAVLRSLPALPTPWDFPEVTWFPAKLATPLVHSGFAGVQRMFGGNLFAEVALLLSRGRELIATDRWNRQVSVPESPTNISGRFNPELPDIIARGNWGRSSYRGLSAMLRRTTNRGIWQVSYTVGRSNDNQSDPVAGEFFDLGFGGGPLSPNASFIRQFDSRADWGHSDYDQRHNLVFFGTHDLPGPLDRWRFSLLGAIRSGFPMTVTTSSFDDNLMHNPADIVNPNLIWSSREPVGGGVRLLNGDAFAQAPAGVVGNSGRNRLYGPGLFSLDVSLNRRFRARFLGEAGEISGRVDVFNVFNHANLNNPETRLDDPSFGIALPGREPRPNAFRLLGPGGETPRQVQLGVRFGF
jgi:hypothetical protein